MICCLGHSSILMLCFSLEETNCSPGRFFLLMGDEHLLLIMDVTQYYSRFCHSNICLLMKELRVHNKGMTSHLSFLFENLHGKMREFFLGMEI